MRLAPAPARTAWCALFPGCHILECASPIRVLAEAARHGVRHDVVYCSTTPNVALSGGVGLLGAAPLPRVAAGDRVFVPGFDLSSVAVPSELIAWLSRGHRAGAEVCSLGTGVFALGAAGILDGRSCTTDSRYLPELRARYPRALIVAGESVVLDDAVVTATSGAGVQLALQLIRDDIGAPAAEKLAREIGADSLDSYAIGSDRSIHSSDTRGCGVTRVREYLRANSAARHSLSAIAAAVSLDERTLTAHFKRATGRTIPEYLTSVRLERAQDLVRNTSLDLETIATACGFTSKRQLRRIWSPRLGLLPGRR